jgi:hypothetical protein
MSHVLFVPRAFDPDAEDEPEGVDSVMGLLDAPFPRGPAPLPADFGSIFDDGLGLAGASEIVRRPLSPPVAVSATQELRKNTVATEYRIVEHDPVTPESVAPGLRLPEDSIPVLPQFVDTGNDIQWPSKTTLHCFWCVHGFDTRPIPSVASVRRDGGFRVQKVDWLGG